MAVWPKPNRVFNGPAAGGGAVHRWLAAGDPVPSPGTDPRVTWSFAEKIGEDRVEGAPCASVAASAGVESHGAAALRRGRGGAGPIDGGERGAPLPGTRCSPIGASG